MRTIGDLLEYFPFRHECRPKSQPIGSLRAGEVATVLGELRGLRSRRSNRGPLLTARIIDGTGTCGVRWFNSSYLTDKLHPGQVIRLTGKVDVYRDLASLTNPQTVAIEECEDPRLEDEDRFDPVYAGTAELPPKQIARIVNTVLDAAVEHIVDFLPPALRAKRRLPPRRTAVLRCHRPTSLEDVPVARGRLAYDELLLSQLALQLARRAMSQGPRANPIRVDQKIDRRIRARLPFDLTVGQDRAVEEIRESLKRTEPMNRLLQGDVGAGKTAVAVYAALATIANRRQVAVLAPTEVLANQHRAKIEHYLQGSRVRIAYLVGSTPRAKRNALLESLREGNMDLLIGTHAVLEEDVRFRDLGLFIIDEQHKFGVVQRAKLRRKGRAPHCLVMTATPIPRTLAMTMFGELDVSTIDGVLPGRKPVDTRLVPPDKEEAAWAFVDARLARGEQAYIVYPLVEESDQLPLKAASAEVDRLAKTTLRGRRVGLLHGRMTASEKADVMARFRDGDIHALVSTTVIEVGVDVPNATIIVIQHAQRYGLSQLHQLRGRVGRSSKKSYCLLLADGASDLSSERLRILCETNDGFRIAEEDLRLRGPGELMGKRQHGLPAFRVADLTTDLGLLAQARDDAADLLRRDPDLSQRQHAALRRTVFKHYGEVLGLPHVA